MRVIAFDSGIKHYDDPPPGELTDLEALQRADRFRFANDLWAWIEVGDAGQITEAGYAGRGLTGSTTLQLGVLRYRFEAVKLPYSPALVTAVETALERKLSVQLMHGGQKPKFTHLKAGDALVRQGDAGSDLYLLLDGAIGVRQGGEQSAEYGPGALLGERSRLEGGTLDLHPDRGHAVPDRLGVGRPVRRRGAHRARHRSPARGSRGARLTADRGSRPAAAPAD